ncbi:MAG: hypothetical protein ACRD2A_06130 [Vicinamibacterales bacterium]
MHRQFIMATVFCAIAVSGTGFAQVKDLRIGQWKNQADPQNERTYSVDGKGMKTEVVNVNRTGEKNVWSYTTMLDGTDAIVTNGGNRHIAAVKKVDPYVNEIAYKDKEGKVTQYATNVVSKDGKTLTVTFKTPEGKQTAVAVYDKVP